MLQSTKPRKIKMQEFTPKPKELIQAQLATFAAEHVPVPQDKGHIFNNIDALSEGAATDITRTTKDVEYHPGKDGIFNMRVPEGTIHTVATQQDYANFIRSVGGSRYESIEGRASLLNAYEHFKPIVSKLRAELSDDDTLRKKHTTFLGTGSNAMAFQIEDEGTMYVVRIPRGKNVKPGVIDSHLAGAVLGKDVSHLEQIVAASYEDGVTIAEVMPGKEVGQLTVDEIKSVTNEQLSMLVDTLITAHDRGIEIDPKPSNIFYDPQEGYGIVDYHSSKYIGRSPKIQELSEVVGWLATDIDNAGFYGRTIGLEKTTEEYAHDLELKKANLDVMQRYKAIVATKLSGETLHKALEVINTRLEPLQESVIHYSNPEWVEKQIAHMNALRAQKILQNSQDPDVFM